MEFATRIRHANSIIVAFAGLMHDEKLVFSRQRRSSESITARLMGNAPRLPPVIRIWKGARCSLRGDRRKIRGEPGMPVTTACAPRRSAVSSKPHGHARGHLARTRLVNPGSTLGSKITVGMRCRRAASIIGPGGVAADAERRSETVAPHNFFRIPQAGRKHRGVAQNLPRRCLSNPRRESNSSGSPACGTSFDSIPRSVPTNHDASHCLAAHAAAIPARRPAPEKRGRRCRRQQSTRHLFARVVQRYSHRPFRWPPHVSSACWLIFKSTPVANSMPNKLEPP